MSKRIPSAHPRKPNIRKHFLQKLPTNQGVVPRDHKLLPLQAKIKVSCCTVHTARTSDTAVYRNKHYTREIRTTDGEGDRHTVSNSSIMRHRNQIYATLSLPPSLLQSLSDSFSLFLPPPSLSSRNVYILLIQNKLWPTERILSFRVPYTLPFQYETVYPIDRRINTCRSALLDEHRTNLP